MEPPKQIFQSTAVRQVQDERLKCAFYWKFEATVMRMNMNFIELLKPFRKNHAKNIEDPSCSTIYGLR